MSPDKNVILKVNELLNEAYEIRVSNLVKSTTLAQEALKISRDIQDINLIGKSLNMLSLFYMIQGEQKLSIEHAEEAIKYFEELNDEQGIADAKYSIASIYYKSDNYHLGLVNLIDCLAIYKKYFDYHKQARTLKSLGTIYEYFGDQKNAIKSYSESIEAAKQVNDKNLESNAYNPLSGIYLNQNRVEKAQEMINKSIEMKLSTNDIRGLAFAYYGRGKVYYHKKLFKEAEADFLESIRIHLEMNERLGIGMSYYKLGALYIATNELDKAKEALLTGIEISNKYNILIIKFNCFYLMYKLYKKVGDIDQSLFYLESYLEVRERVINSQTLKIIENYDLIKRMENLQRETEIQKEKAEILEKTHKAEHAAKAKQEFLSTMSHEIRTPLNAVISIAHLLEDTATPEQIELIQSLGFASNNLMQIINDILDFTKLDTNKMNLEWRSTNILNLMESIKNTYANLAADKQLDLSLNIDDSINTWYLIDETKLTQILNNLISNAIKYTNVGNVTISLSKIASTNNSDTIRFSVNDTGVGIPEKYFDDIFESFYQPKSITTKTQGGTGLGLAIVKKLVELFGGSIKLKSSINKGSEFFFELTLNRSLVKDTAINITENNLGGKSVLIVDDNVINSFVASKLLNKWGMQTDLAANGKEAIVKALNNKYDFILMDIHMPLMDGFESCHQIRTSNGLNKHTPIFALTADVTATEHEGFNLDFNGMLSKPINIDKLFETLKQSSV